MKRRLSLLLAVVMILGSFTMAFAAEESAEAKAGAFLKEVGVLEGINGDLKLEDNLRRQDMVVLIARLHGAEEEAEKFPTEDLKFTDFKDPYYRPIIAWAVANELIEGHTPERFGFNENVTAQQYATVLLRALGYNDKVADVEGYAKALEEAKALGILENVEVENDTVVTRGQMAAMTFNALGVKVKDSDKTLAEKLGIEMPAPEVLEAEVFADNFKEIQVKFNRAVDRDNVEDIDIYTTNAGSIKDAQLVEGNTVILTLEGEMKNKGYTLTIRGLKEGGPEVNKDYKFTAVDNTIPEVADVVGLGTKAIKVVMTEPVKNAKASSFAIDGKAFYGSVNTIGREIILKPYGSDFGVGEHTLVVKSLEDYAGFKSVQREVKFEISEDNEAPTVVEIKGTMERIVVTFSEDVDDATVTKDSLYWGGAKSNKANNVVRLSGNRYAFEFTDEKKALPTYETVITVSGVKDYSGNEMKAQDVPFKAEIDQTRPEVLDVDVSATEIEVKFNKRLNAEDAKDKRNYTLLDEDGKKVSIKDIELSADGRTVTIKLYSELKENKEYTLKISGIRDNTKLANTILPYEETITPGNYKRPVVSAVTGNPAKQTIHILFNKKMDVETISNPANYMLVHENGTRYALDAIRGDVDVIQDGRAVILLLPEKIGGDKVEDMTFTKNGKDIVGVVLSGSIKDTSGNRVQKYGEVEYFTDGEVVATAEATDKRTIELEFSHPVTAAKASDFVAKGFDIDEVKVDGTTDVVIKTKGDLHPGLAKESLFIDKDNKIETVLDLEVGNGKTDIEVELVDRIKPTLEEAKGTINKSETKLTLKLTFDESLNEDYEELAKRDLTIKRADGKVIDMTKSDVVSTIKGEIVTIETTQHVKKDMAYEIEITNPGAIRDATEGNVVNKTDGAVIAEDIEVEADEDEEKAEEVIAKINALPEVDKLELKDEPKVVDARTEYDKLNPEQKKLVSDELVEKLEAAENKIKDLKAEDEATKKEEAKKALEAKIAEAKIALVDGDEKDQEPKDVLKGAITAAEEVLNDFENKTIEELEDATNTLDDAIKAFAQ